MSTADGNPQDIEYHVLELRQRLIRSLLAFGVAAVVGFYFSGSILSFLQADLGVGLNALTAYETIYTQLMLASLFGLFIAAPVLLYEMLAFLKPGLTDTEYAVVRNYLPFAVGLFVAGAAFSYQFIVKSALQFFAASTAAADVNAVWGLQATIGFAIKVSALAGVLFQLPIVALVLGRAGLITAAQMVQYRAYFIVGVLITAAVATPPDIITQLLITLPVIGLYEISIRLVQRTQR